MRKRTQRKRILGGKHSKSSKRMKTEEPFSVECNKKSISISSVSKNVKEHKTPERMIQAQEVSLDDFNEEPVVAKKQPSSSSSKTFNIDKEIQFIKGVEMLKRKYGEDFGKLYWKPQRYENGFPLRFENAMTDIERDFNLVIDKLYSPEKSTYKEKREYMSECNALIKKRKFNLPRYDEQTFQLVKAAIHRYDAVGALDNISLSVHPNKKEEWGITHEMFGAFYNTKIGTGKDCKSYRNSDYNGLFNDIEANETDAIGFEAKSGMVILCNPPYTEEWIIKSIEMVNEMMDTVPNLKVYMVLPMWNKSDRLANTKNVKQGEEWNEGDNELKMLDEMKEGKYTVSWELVEKFPFWSGITCKDTILGKQLVHVGLLSNSTL